MHASIYIILIVLMTLLPLAALLVVVVLHTAALFGSWRKLALNFAVESPLCGQRIQWATIQLRPMMHDRATASIIFTQQGLYLEPLSPGVVRRPKRLLIPWACIGEPSRGWLGRVVLPVYAAGVWMDVYLPTSAADALHERMAAAHRVR